MQRKDSYSRTSKARKAHHALKGHISRMWEAMFKTENGYRRHSLGNTGKGTDRRNDKVQELGFDSVTNKLILAPFNPPERKIERAARLGTIGIRN